MKQVQPKPKKPANATQSGTAGKSTTFQNAAEGILGGTAKSEKDIKRETMVHNLHKKKAIAYEKQENGV